MKVRTICYIANILFGGVIGLLIVDPATGAMWKLDQDVSLTLTRRAPQSGTDGGAQLRILSLDQLPARYRGGLERVR